MADYFLDFNCRCGGNLGVFINWNNGDEYIRCTKNNCCLNSDWLNEQQTKLEKGNTTSEVV